jgi:PAS domain S-box-containing protein
MFSLFVNFNNCNKFLMNQATDNNAYIFERITDAVIGVDNNFYFSFVNKTAAHFFDKPIDYLIGKNIWLEFEEKPDSQFRKACNNSMASQQFISIETFSKKRDEWFESNIYPSADGLTIIIKKIPVPNVLESELKVAEQELKNSSERFDLVTKATNDMIWDWDFVSNEVWWNYNFNKFFGYDLDKTSHHISSWINNIHDEDRKRVVEGIYAVINSGEKYWTDEYRYLKRDGTILNIYDRGYVQHDAANKPFRMIGSMLNITDRIKAEQAVRESEEKYRTLVDQASDAIYITDKNGTIHTVNPSSCTMTGYSEKELLEMNIWGFVDPNDIIKNPFRFEELEQGKTVYVERKLKVKNGVELELEFTAKMLIDGRILVFARDISVRKKVENDIIKERNFSESIINSLPGIFYIHDFNGILFKWNKNLETVSGYTNSEMNVMHPLDFFDASERAMLTQKATDVFNDEPVKIEATLFTKNRVLIPYQIISTKIMFDNKPCLIAIGMDVAEKKVAEDLLKKSYDEVSRLAAHVTNVRDEERKRIGREIHDELGQQLTAIKMDVIWIDKKITGETNPLKANLKNILEIIEGSNKSVRRLLHELTPGVIDNNGLLEALIAQNNQFIVSAGISIEFLTTVTEINLSQEISNCIFRVYQESLTNIMRYANATKVVSTLQLMNNNILVSIEDDGLGFDMFADKSKKSFGILGMRERVLSQNGTFELQSKQGVGTKIMFSVPLGM